MGGDSGQKLESSLHIIDTASLEKGKGLFSETITWELIVEGGMSTNLQNTFPLSLSDQLKHFFDVCFPNNVHPFHFYVIVLLSIFLKEVNMLTG